MAGIKSKLVICKAHVISTILFLWSFRGTLKGRIALWESFQILRGQETSHKSATQNLLCYMAKYLFSSFHAFQPACLLYVSASIPGLCSSSSDWIMRALCTLQPRILWLSYVWQHFPWGRHYLPLNSAWELCVFILPHSFILIGVESLSNFSLMALLHSSDWRSLPHPHQWAFVGFLLRFLADVTLEDTWRIMMLLFLPNHGIISPL